MTRSKSCFVSVFLFNFLLPVLAPSIRHGEFCSFANSSDKFVHTPYEVQVPFHQSVIVSVFRTQTQRTFIFCLARRYLGLLTRLIWFYQFLLNHFVDLCLHIQSPCWSRTVPCRRDRLNIVMAKFDGMYCDIHFSKMVVENWMSIRSHIHKLVPILQLLFE